MYSLLIYHRYNEQTGTFCGLWSRSDMAVAYQQKSHGRFWIRHFGFQGYRQNIRYSGRFRKSPETRQRARTEGARIKLKTSF